MEVRDATEADVPGIRRLFVELHDYSARHVPSRLRVEDHYDEEKQSKEIRKLIHDASTSLLIALEGDALLGLAEVHVRDPEEMLGVVPVLRGHLQSLVVTESARREGVGLALLNAAEDWARARGAAEMELDNWVFPDGPGEFYERVGYLTLSEMRVKRLD